MNSMNMKKNNYRTWGKWAALTALMMVMACNVQAQLLAARTNALLWGNLTPNIGLELVTSARTSVSGNVFYSLDANPMDCSTKGAEVQLRYWISGRPMVRSFVALGVQGMRYDAEWSDNRHFGDAVGPGIVYGYSLPLGKRFNIEFSAGMSIMWFRERKYPVGTTEPEGDYNFKGNKVMPMGLGVTCTYILK